jgi:recombination protein RecT
MSKELTIEDRIFDCESRFNAINNYQLNFKRECSFAFQILRSNDYLLKVAKENPESLEDAITNIAACGLTLNPSAKEAYLVPRGKKICFDPSYIGIANSATKEGHLLWVQAEVVKSNDSFELQGFGKAPIHKMNPFGDRGEIVGTYVVAKTPDGEYLTTVMSKAECHAIRDRTEAWKAYKEGKTKSCPWLTDEGEMMKKTVIKRASKLWGKCERLEKVVELSNENDGIDFGKEKLVAHVDPSAFLIEPPKENDFTLLRERLAISGRSEEQLIKALKAQFKDLPEKIEQFNSAQYEYAKRKIEDAIAGGAK